MAPTKLHALPQTALIHGERQRFRSFDPLVQLRNDVRQMTPTLKRWVYASIPNKEHRLKYNKESEVLRESVCGRSARAFAFMLRQKGYDAQEYQNPFGDKHEIILVPNMSDVYTNSITFIVDPTYLQFLEIFRLGRKNLPRDDVLVMAEEQIIEVARQFAGLGKLHMAKEILARAISETWNLHKFYPAGQTVEDCIRLCKTGAPQKAEQALRELVFTMKKFFPETKQLKALSFSQK